MGAAERCAGIDGAGGVFWRDAQQLGSRLVSDSIEAIIHSNTMRSVWPEQRQRAQRSRALRSTSCGEAEARVRDRMYRSTRSAYQPSPSSFSGLGSNITLDLLASWDGLPTLRMLPSRARSTPPSQTRAQLRRRLERSLKLAQGSSMTLFSLAGLTPSLRRLPGQRLIAAGSGR